MKLGSLEPIGHIPPLPPIELNPRHPITPAEAKTCWEIEADEARAKREAVRAEAIWKLVRQVAEGTNMPSRQPVEAVAGIPTTDTSGMSMAFGTAWKFISGRWVRVDPETGVPTGG